MWRGLSQSVSVDRPKSGAEPILTPPIALWAAPTPGLTWWIMWAHEVIPAGYHGWNPLRPFWMSQGQIPCKDPLKSFEPETWELLCKWGVTAMHMKSYQEKVKGWGEIARWEESWRTIAQLPLRTGEGVAHRRFLSCSRYPGRAELLTWQRELMRRG